jgi:hypothetical protein
MILEQTSGKTPKLILDIKYRSSVKTMFEKFQTWVWTACESGDIKSDSRLSVLTLLSYSLGQCFIPSQKFHIYIGMTLNSGQMFEAINGTCACLTLKWAWSCKQQSVWMVHYDTVPHFIYAIKISIPQVTKFHSNL